MDNIAIATESVPKPTKELIAAFKEAPTSIISDNLAIHKALELEGPSDFIAVDDGGDETRALVGEIMKNIAQWRGRRRHLSVLRARGDLPRALQGRPRARSTSRWRLAARSFRPATS
jgi:hypothetical protein